MNVLHLIDSEGLYGAEHVLLNLLPALHKLNVNVTLGCMSPVCSAGADIGRELEKRGVPVIYIDERKKISIRGLRAIYSAQRTTRADIVHVHGYKASILGGVIAQLTGVPLISTYHGEAKQRPELVTYARIEAFILKGSSHIIAVSNRIRNELIARGIDDDKISVVYNGIEDPLKTAEVKSVTRGSKDHVRNIICVGRLIPLKRFDLVIDAINILKDKHPDICLLIAGSGPLEPDLKKKVDELGLKDRVHILGHVKNTEELYASASLFILSSQTEGSPIALIEAMAYSLPVITTSVGAIPEMIQHGREAYVIPPDNLNTLIENIDYLMSHPDQCEALGNAGRDMFLKKYNSDVMARCYIEQYKDVLRN